MNVNQYSSSDVLGVIALWLAAGAVASFLRVRFAEKYGARVHWTTVLVDVLVGPYSFITVIRVIANVKAVRGERKFEPTQSTSGNKLDWPPPAR